MRTVANLVFLAALLLIPGAAQQLPRPATPLTIKLPNGKTADPSTHKGKVVVLALIKFTCPHCQEFTQVLNKVYPDYKTKDVVFLEADITDDGPATIKTFLTRYQPPFPVGTADPSKHHEFLQTSPMKLTYVPKLVIIDKNGMIRTQFYGDHAFYRDAERQLRGHLDVLLKEAGPKPTAPPAAKKK